MLGHGQAVAHNGASGMRIVFSLLEQNFQTSVKDTVYYSTKSQELFRLLGDSAKVCRIDVNRSFDQGYTTSIEVAILNLEKFESDIASYSWRIFSDDFNKEMDDTLAD